MLCVLVFFCVLLIFVVIVSVYLEMLIQMIYFGNEGIMVSDGYFIILFDLFYLNGFGVYQMVLEVMCQDLMFGVVFFDSVDVIFISYMYLDYFFVDEIIIYLQIYLEVCFYVFV